MALKYKVGDRVQIKNIDWYNANKSKSHGTVACADKYFDYDMREWCGKTMTIFEVHQTCYLMEEDGFKHLWTDEMIECKVETLKYKVGDKVRIKSLDWYNENSDDKYNVVLAGGWYFSKPMSILCGKELIIDKISHVTNPPYYIMEDNTFAWTDEMIEGLVEEEEIEFTEEDKYWCDIMSESDPTTYVLPEGYIFKDENDNVINATKIILEKKKKEYPNNFYHCVRTLGLYSHPADASRYKTELIRKLQTLLVCRDAYWKIAGEELGLGKPWEPDLLDDNQSKFVLANWDDNIEKRDYSTNRNYILTFPSGEMRDAFYKNFKSEIEICKELL